MLGNVGKIAGNVSKGVYANACKTLNKGICAYQNGKNAAHRTANGVYAGGVKSANKGYCAYQNTKIAVNKAVAPAATQIGGAIKSLVGGILGGHK